MIPGSEVQMKLSARTCYILVTLMLTQTGATLRGKVAICVTPSFTEFTVYL